MAITKEKKTAIIEKVTKVLSDAGSVVFVNFRGLGVQDTNTLRCSLRDVGVGYTVAKKTLIGRALDSVKTEGERPSFEGELALAYTTSTDDVLAPAREVRVFSKTHKDNIKILGGIFEGIYKSDAEMIEIADIPSQDVLRGMFVNIINSPIQGFVIALNAIAEKKA